MTDNPLSPEEKVAGRKFRSHQQALLLETFKSDPPDHQAPNFLAIFRHNCKKRQGRSTALELKEIYIHSPEYVVYNTTDGLVAVEGGEEWAATNLPADDTYTLIPAGRFGFAYKQGKCKDCSTARSKAGRLVDAHNRPPLAGRVTRS